MKPTTSNRKAQKPSAPAKATPPPNPMWGGQFGEAPDSVMQAINQSLHVDKRMYRQDIQGSRAHARMLAAQGILPKKAVDAILKGLAAVEKEIETGAFPFDVTLEDIHMNIEARLKTLAGEAAGRLHTARSRNDQVATDFRLWVRDAIDMLDAALKQAQAALIARAGEHAATLMPGFTHLQTAQPVTLGHHLMAYVEMLGRDRARFKGCRERLNECPLGAAALAGTSFPINRHATAKELGFASPMENSLDAVASRDFALEFLSAAAICAVHLSRLAEEFVLWSSAQFGFIRFSDRFSTGSSIMPQKRNPDAAELVRAKPGRMAGSLMQLLMVMKGLPLAYNKDMQEDKEAVFAASDDLHLAVRATAGMVADFTADAERMQRAAGEGYSTATDLADWLVRVLALPFREAHHITARIVARAAKQGCALADLPLADMQAEHKAITKDVLNVLSAVHSAKSRTSYGGTSPANVREAITRAKRKYL